MNKVAAVLGSAIVAFGCGSAYAQGGAAGTWRVEDSGSPASWELVLRLDGPTRVVGAVSSCASVAGAYEISRGLVDENTITFQCTSRDLQRIISFTGRINGDVITFSWAKEVREGGYPAPNDALFGASAPPQFTARRATDAVDAVATRADRAHRYSPITFERILHAAQEPHNWLTYSGTLLGQRYSPLTQITPENVKNLEPAWIWQAQSDASAFEATPLAVDGVLYTVQMPNKVVALNAVTGRVLWTYSYQPGPDAITGYGQINRGLAILGDTLFMGTLDAHLVAISAYTGKAIWIVSVADVASCKACYGITDAPLVVKDKVIVGLGSGDRPSRGAIAAFDTASGKEVWRFNTVPASGEPGSETWAGDSWRTGGAGVWNTGSYDADLNLTYWGTGNPFPVVNGDSRRGDNLYSDSVVALDADTGALRWYYQFTPHDTMDWDATQIPVLADLEWRGQPRRVMLWANRNGLMYMLDRATGEFLMGRPFVEVNWMSGFDAKGRPRPVAGLLEGSDKSAVRPVPETGGTIWEPPSYSARTGLFYIAAWDVAAGSGAAAYGAVRAFDPRTGEKKWEFKNDRSRFSGVLTTASDLLFVGVGDRYFYGLNAGTGRVLWQMPVAGRVYSAPMSYSVEGRQYVAIAAGNVLYAFAIRQ